MRKLLKILSILMVSGVSHAGRHVMIYDPVTFSSVTLTGTGIRFSDGSTQTSAGGGGGSSSLEVMANGVRISSPTATLSLLAGSNITLAGTAVGTTAQITITSTGGSSSLNSTQTWTGQNNWTTPAQSTFTYGVVVGSLTVNGAGSGQMSATEGTAPAGVSGSDILYGDSTAHAWKVMNNNGVASQVVVSSVSPTTGHIASWSGTGTLIDGGTGGGGSGTPGGSDTQVQYNNSGSFGGTPLETVDASSVSFNNISSMTYVGFSTMVFQSGTGIDVSSGTLFVSTITFSNGSLLEVNASELAAVSSMSVSGYFQLSSKTASQIRALTPSAAGQAYYCSDCTIGDTVCISTGATFGSFSVISASRTYCH